MYSEILYLLAGLAAVECGIHLFSVIVIVPIFERRLPFEVAQAEPDETAERVSIPTPDGLTLRGALYLPDEDPLGIVIFCPEYRGNHWMAMDYCQGLVDSGFAVLGFDFRGQGESDAANDYEPLHWITEFEVRDVQSVVSYVRSRVDLADLPIGLMGASRGAGAALAVAANDDQLRCVVADSAFTTDTLMVLYAARWVQYNAPRWFRLPEWHLAISCRLARLVSQLRRKVVYPSLEPLLSKLWRKDVLLIAGERDTYVPPESSTRIRKQIGGESSVWYVRRATHNLARQTDPIEYDKHIVDLFLNMVPIHRLPPPVTAIEREPGLSPTE